MKRTGGSRKISSPRDVVFAEEKRAITDAELVGQAVEGSQEAFREIVERYQRPVFSLIVRMVRDRALAEDLSQEAFVKAYRGLASFDPRRKFSSWLFKIAHNATIDHLRRRSLDVEPLETSGEGLSPAERVEDASIHTPAQLVESGALGVALEEAILSLRPDYREVVVLRFLQGMAYQEIAEVTGMALGTVKTNIHRARKELAELLSEEGWLTEQG